MTVIIFLSPLVIFHHEHSSSWNPFFLDLTLNGLTCSKRFLWFPLVLLMWTVVCLKGTTCLHTLVIIVGWAHLWRSCVLWSRLSSFFLDLDCEVTAEVRLRFSSIMVVCLGFDCCLRSDLNADSCLTLCLPSSLAHKGGAPKIDSSPVESDQLVFTVWNIWVLALRGLASWDLLSSWQCCLRNSFSIISSVILSVG